MRIKAGDTIVNQPALAIRKLMQYGRELGPDTSGNTIDTIIEILKVDLPTAEQIFQDLCTEGYIEPTLHIQPSNGDSEHWYTTMKGNTLANATARKPITRHTAEQQIKKFLDRVEQINAGDYAQQIKQVVIFGSYLSDSLTLGDIDLSITLERRYDDPQKQRDVEQKRVKAARQQGRTFKSSLDQLFWPHNEVWLILKGHSPSLSLHDEKQEQVLSRPIPSKILFDANVDKQ